MPKFSARKRLRCLTAAVASFMTLNSAFGNSVANCNADAILVFDASASMSGVGESRQSVLRIEEAREAVRQGTVTILIYAYPPPPMRQRRLSQRSTRRNRVGGLRLPTLYSALPRRLIPNARLELSFS